MFFSIIIPVFNRPEEVDELLQSLTLQTSKNFEVILAEDGSIQKSDKVANKYADKLTINYFEKPNSGPGTTRNAGAEKAKFDYLIFFDSDCIIPERYIEHVSDYLSENYHDAYGGPDAALPDFTTVQKAINYSMTSFFTTGGIRGGNKSMDKFHPRTFNLGVSKEAFEQIGGFGKMRFGEDIDFSLRLLSNGFKTTLIGMISVVFLSLFNPLFILVPIIYSILVFIDSLTKNKSHKVALTSISASWVQLFGYGLGFIKAVWRRLILKQGEFKAFEKKFYD